jgi:flagellar basal-body rod protein FlgF
MDRVIYTAMTGAAQALEQQTTVANNLSNLSTTGFRAQLSNFRDVPLEFGDGNGKIDTDVTRTYVVSATPGADFTAGPIEQTGNPLDLAVQGPGWLSVQTEGGGEAYTRAGNLHVDQNGQLVTANNLPVLGNNGPVAVPPGSTVLIGKDGTVSALGAGNAPNTVAILDRLKLVNPPEATMLRGDDGLFRAANGQPAAADPTVQVMAGALEGSNVNPVSAMVDMITNARSFQMHTKMLETADKNEQSANQLLSFS